MSDDTVTNTETTTQTQTTQDPVLNSITDPFESRARRMGWVSKDEFRGDGGAQWVDAETFVRRAEQSADILIERNKALDRRLENSEKSFSEYKKNSEKQLGDMTKQLTEMRDTLVDFRNFAATANERAYKRARSELETEMRQAVADADVSRFDKAKAQADELDKEATQYVKTETRREEQTQAQPTQTQAQPQAQTQTDLPATPPPPPPEVQVWLNRNQWFLNPEFSYMNQYAQRMHMKLLREEPNLSLSQNLDKVTDLTKKKFPEEFGINPRREEAAATVTNASTSRSTAKKELGYDDLPPEAKQACDRYVKMIPNYSREEYVKTYFAGEEEV